MKLAALTDNLRRRMTPEARRALGKHGMTAEDAAAAFDVRSERDLQKQIANLLRLRGIWFSWARMDRATTNMLGTPDFLFARAGQACAMEVKFGKGKLRVEQERAVLEMERNGWCVAVVRSVEEAREFLNNQ